MKVLVFALGVLGLSAAFGLFEPAAASGQLVASNEVCLVAEQISERTDSGRTCGSSARHIRHRPHGGMGRLPIEDR
jgi:hypothetical protein